MLIAQNIERHFGLPVVIGTHPIPLKYMKSHGDLSFWNETGMQETAALLMTEDRAVRESYN